METWNKALRKKTQPETRLSSNWRRKTKSRCMQVSIYSYRMRSVLTLAALPVVTLAVCPVMDSPFYAAKFTVLLGFGAMACLLLPKATSVSGAIHPEVDRVRHRVLPVCFGAWVLATCIATAYAHAWATAWRPMAEYGSAIAVAAVLIRLSVERSKLLLWMSISASVLACLVLAGWAGYDLPRLLTGATAPGRMRTAATLGNPLFVASFLSAAMWSVCALQRLHIVWRASLLLLILLALAATGERTAIAGILAGVTCWLASAAQHKPKRAKLQIMLALIAVVALFAATQALNPRSLRTAADGRIFLWKTSLHHLPLLGAGAGSFPSHYAENIRDLAPHIPASNFVYVAFENQAHNLFVQQIVEAGPFGAIAFVGFLAVWFSSAWKGRSRIEVRAALAGTAAFLASACFDNPLSRPEGVLLLACWMTVPYLCSGKHPSSIPTCSSRRSQNWTHNMLPLCSVALLIVACANAVCSYAIYSGEHAEQLAQWPQAEYWLRVALKVDPAAQDAHFDLVRVLCESGDYGACWAESERALHWVNEAELHLLRVRVLEALGHDESAQQELITARQQFPWSRELRLEQVASTSTPTFGY